MAFQPEVVSYDAGVYQLEVIDPVDGGVGAVSNKPLLNLANRTAYLYQHVNNLENGTTIPPTVAPLNNANLTGTPTAPTPALGDNSTKISTTAFVQGTVNGLASVNVAGGANVTLTAVQAGNGILVFTGALTANIAVIVPNSTKTMIVENLTSGAFTLTVKTAAGTGVAITQGKTQELFCDGTNVLLSSSDFVNMALTGTATAPTPSVGDQSTKIATTNFVYQITNGVVTVNVAGNSDVTLTPAQYGNGIILLTGALTGAINVIVPAQGGTYVVANKTTGAFSVNLWAGGGGTKALVPQGQSVVAYCDGTNVVLAGAAASSSFSNYSFTATAAQTVFNAPYTPGNILVLVNGAAQDPADITATNGSSVTLTAYNGGAGAIAGDNVRIIAFNSFTVANALTLAGGTMAGPIQMAGGDTGVTPAQNDNSTKIPTTAWVNPLAAHGQCRLSVVSTTSLKLAPYGGQCLNINGTVQQIPQGGVSISNASLAASTVYYVYAYMNAGAMALQLSATGHVTGANGVEVCNGNAALTLVGMISTNASSQFVDSAAQRFCLNWFNRRTLPVTNLVNATFSNTSLAELTPSFRAYFLSWADEAVSGGVHGNASNNTAATGAYLVAYLDGNAWGPTVGATSAAANNNSAYVSLGNDFVSEGSHFMTLYGYVGAGTEAYGVRTTAIIRG